MTFTVYQTNKKTGTVYAYSQESFRDPETKKNKVRRTYLGRVDPVTKLIIEKAEGGKRNRSNNKEDAQNTVLPSEVYDSLDDLRKQIKGLSEQFSTLAQEQKRVNQILNQLQKAFIVQE